MSLTKFKIGWFYRDSKGGTYKILFLDPYKITAIDINEPAYSLYEGEPELIDDNDICEQHLDFFSLDGVYSEKSEDAPLNLILETGSRNFPVNLKELKR